jgi:hypothetical protein
VFLEYKLRVEADQRTIRGRGRPTRKEMEMFWKVKRAFKAGRKERMLRIDRRREKEGAVGQRERERGRMNVDERK